nr:hypothetical protein [Candidatus Sigynarchaeota archaeon]
MAATKPSFFEAMLPHVLQFFETRVSPIPEAEMLEIVAFIEAVNESMAKRGIICPCAKCLP